MSTKPNIPGRPSGQEQANFVTGEVVDAPKINALYNYFLEKVDNTSFDGNFRIQLNEGVIQYRYGDSGPWIDVVDLSLITDGISIADVSGLEAALNAKQNTLVSGTNIKTINGDSLLGSGDIVIPTPSDVSDLTDTTNLLLHEWNNLGGTQSSVNISGFTNDSGFETTTQLNARDTANRNRSNHTGTQPSSTISDFSSTVRSTVLTGLSTVTNAVITAADSVLSAFGKLQAQISGLASSKQDTLVSGTNIKTVNGNSLLGSGNLTIVGVTVVSVPASPTASGAVGQIAYDTNFQYTYVGDGVTHLWTRTPRDLSSWTN